MTLLERRRAMMGQKTDPSEYISDGLVLWMDGINKGNIENAWVDQINGHVFEGINSPTFGDSYALLDSTQQQYFRNNTFTPPQSDVGTIEVVYEVNSVNDTSPIFMSNVSGAIAFLVTDKHALISIMRNLYWTDFTEVKGSYSCISTRRLLNGVEMPSTGGDYLYVNNVAYNTIGTRLGRTYFVNGKVFCIRIYDRQLSLTEQLRNYKADKIRFGLT